MDVDRRVLRRYELDDEAGRLWRPGRGDLVRLRTWDIFERHLPPAGRVADIGGGPGTHAAQLAGLGYEVVLVDPVPAHVAAAAEAGVDARQGDARALNLADDSFDAVLLMGPLYHLPDPADRARALGEALRILRPGGRLLAEVITRHAWLLDATSKGLLGEPGIRQDVDRNLTDGLSTDPERLPDGGFWAYFHAVDELAPEVGAAGFADIELLAVEGFAWILGNLAELLEQPEALLRALRLTETEPSLLGVSAHVMAVATKPVADV